MPSRLAKNRSTTASKFCGSGRASALGAGGIVILASQTSITNNGSLAVNRAALPLLAEPYVSGAPEVEALMRLHAADLRVEEVAVHMRERSSGASKLRGSKAVKLVLTVTATLVFFRWFRRRGA